MRKNEEEITNFKNPGVKSPLNPPSDAHAPRSSFFHVQFFLRSTDDEKSCKERHKIRVTNGVDRFPHDAFLH